MASKVSGDTMGGVQGTSAQAEWSQYKVTAQQVASGMTAEFARQNIAYLKEGTLGRKIAEGSWKYLSTKQSYAVAAELVKNPDFVKAQQQRMYEQKIARSESKGKTKLADILAAEREQMSDSDMVFNPVTKEWQKRGRSGYYGRTY